MADCLFHDDKDTFDLVQRDLVKSKWLPKKCAHRLAMAVCSCRKNKGVIPTSDEFLDLRVKLEDKLNLSQVVEELSSRAITYIKDCMYSRYDTDYSRFQFMKVLELAQRDNYYMLSRDAISTNKSVSEREQQRQINKKRPLTTAQIEIIKQKKIKKLKKMESEVVKLAIFPGNFRRMEHILGSKLQEVAMDNQSYAQLQNAQNDQSMASKKAETFIKIWGNPENIKTLGQRLAKCAREAQKQMDDQRKERKARKVERFLDEMHENDSTEDDVMHGLLKDRLHDDFVLKTHKAWSKGQSQKVKVPSSVLDGGHCYQCYKEFSDLKDDSSCTYHEGYRVTNTNDFNRGQMWSCCHAKVHAHEDAYTQHSTSGCLVSVVHKWRPHSKAKGKERDETFGPWSAKLNHNVTPRFKPKSRRLRRIRPKRP